MAALQLAEHGYFCKEMNVGFAEWAEAGNPTHEGAPAEGQSRCTCAK